MPDEIPFEDEPVANVVRRIRRTAFTAYFVFAFFVWPTPLIDQVKASSQWVVTRVSKEPLIKSSDAAPIALTGGDRR